MPRLGEVFVAGGQPTVTYVRREHLGLEEQIRTYLEIPFKILSVSGPTKTGKTVLVRSVLPRLDSFWVSGGQVRTENDFWERILEQVGGFTETSATNTEQEAQKDVREFDASAKIAGFGGGAKSVHADERSSGMTSGQKRTVSASTAAVAALLKQKRPVVIDDFHYIDQAVQLRIVRSLKDPVFEGLPVVVLSVPHRAFDPVRVEREMTGRVAQVQVPFWDPEELRAIADKGFAELNVRAGAPIVDRLIQEAFSSPHLMQDFCAGICLANNIVETRAEPFDLRAPDNWADFFRARAAGTSKSAFDRLAIGPRQRTDRMARQLKNGETCDIYTAVLLAIAKTGPLTQLRYEDVRQGLREVLDDVIPQSNEVTRVLEQMSRIAHEEIQGEPVVDWDKEFSTLHISDPFFAYYLRWGTNLP